MGNNTSSDDDTFEDAVNDTSSTHVDVFDMPSGTKDMDDKTTVMTSVDNSTTGKGTSASEENASGEAEGPNSKPVDESSDSMKAATPKSNLLFFHSLEVMYIIELVFRSQRHFTGI